MSMMLEVGLVSEHCTLIAGKVFLQYGSGNSGHYCTILKQINTADNQGQFGSE